jgi:PAS domain S-box-containing protein
MKIIGRIMMIIGIVGGGTQCSQLLDLIEKKAFSFKEINPRVKAIAEERDDAPGVMKAKEAGIHVTRDYNDFFKRDDIDLIIELTGRQEIFDDIMMKKKKGVRLIDSRTAKFFWEVGRDPWLLSDAAAGREKTKTMYDVLLNDLFQEDVMVIGLYYRVLDVNESMLKKLGLTREEVIGKRCYQISHRQDHPCGGEEHPCPLQESLNTKKPSQTTHIHRDKDNQKIYCSISCYPIFENGEVVGAVELSKDITKEIHLERAMMQQQKLASVGQLAAGVAHEINNPLTTILTTTMLMQEDLDPEDADYQEFQTIINETLRCRKIVTNLLNFARQGKPMIKEHDINKIVSESISLTRKQGAFEDIILEKDLSDNIPHVYVDKDQIQQSLINLILNAIDATEAGGKIRVTTAYHADTGMVDIVVSDTGQGISEEDLDHVFDPFFTSKERGTGLGLAITHGLIKQNEGFIDVKSKPGKGTTFTIKLPIAGGDKDAQ